MKYTDERIKAIDEILKDDTLSSFLKLKSVAVIVRNKDWKPKK